MATHATIVTQYRDPFTGVRRTLSTCDEHTDTMLHLLRATRTGCGSTTAPGLFDCDVCVSEGGES